MPPTPVVDIYIDDKVWTSVDLGVVYTNAQLYTLLQKYQPVKTGKTFVGLVDSNGNPPANNDESFVIDTFYTVWSYDPVWVEGQVLRDIAQAIRAKAGLNQSTIIKVDDMATLIANL